MGNFSTVLRIVMRRSVANRRLLATVVFGVIMSAALLSSVVLYSDAIRDLGLRHTLRTADPDSLNLRITFSARPGVAADYAAKTDQIAATLAGPVGGVLDETNRYVRSATFYLAAPGQPFPAEDSRPRAHFQYKDRLDEHTKLVEGRRPEETRPTPAAPRIEVLMGKAAADQLQVRLGDTFDLHPFWRDDKQPVTVVVVGFLAPNDESEPYWFGRDDRFIVTSTSWPTYPFFVSEETITDVLGGYMNDMDSSIETYGMVDIDEINSRNARLIEDTTRGFERGIPEQVRGGTYESKLADTIGSYRTKLFFTRLPLFALMFQVVGIALYYLVMVSTMLVERQTGEIALLRSRGASVRQVMSIYLVEGLILCGLAALLGSLLAKAGIAVLGLTPAFSDLSEGELLPVPFSRAAFGLAAGGALLALLAILWPAWRAARHSMIDYKHGLARPQQQPLFLRYYLDLVLVAVGAFLFYQLREKGSLVTNRLFGDLSADPLLLLSPTLFMLMVALVFLRIFPMALRLAAWAAKGLNGPTIALGLSRMTRAPLHYSRLILLLLLATAVGMFAAGFRATLERGYDDRAAHTAGAESRLEGVRAPANLTNETFAAQIQSSTGAEIVSPASRQQGSYSITQFRSEPLSVLGVVPDELRDLAFWRDDFASSSLNGLLEDLPVTIVTPDAAQVPGDARWIGLWAQMPLPANQGGLALRLQDSAGIFWEYRLGTEGPVQRDTWQFFVADMRRPAQTRFGSTATVAATGPKRLDSVFLRMTGQPPQVPERVSALVDDVQVSNVAALPQGFGRAGLPGAQVVEPFDDLVRYELINGAGIFSEPGSINRAEVTGREGQFAARISFTRERGTPSVLGLRIKRTNEPLPVAVESSFLSAADKKVGDTITLYVNRQYVESRITGSFDLFPGHDPNKPEHLIIADLASLQELASRVPSVADGIFANEAWMSETEPGVMTKEALARVGVTADGIFSRADVRAAQAADPLIAASWEGILFLAFGAVLLLTSLGFAVYAHVAAQTRSLEFAILRTMGFSNRQVLSLVTFEQCFVIIAGVAVGTFLGFPLGRLMIGYLGVTEEGGDPVPPLLSQVSWSAVFTVYGLLAVVFIGTIASLAAVYSRLAVHRALRIGEL